MANKRVYFAENTGSDETDPIPEPEGNGAVLIRSDPKGSAADAVSASAGPPTVLIRNEPKGSAGEAAAEQPRRRNGRSWVKGGAEKRLRRARIGSSKTRLVVREHRARDLTTEFVHRWDDLETRSREANPFLSPWFVLPALEHLPVETEKDPLVLSVETPNGDELLGLGIFEPCLGTRFLPLPHLRSWTCEHSFLDGLLLDNERSSQAATALFEWVMGQGNQWHGISFRDRSDDTESSWALEEAASRCGIPWRENRRTERAFTQKCPVQEDCVGEPYHGKRRRELNRRVRKLESFGEVDFSVTHYGRQHSLPLESLLGLEASGWKGEEHTALLCHPGHQRFARAMVAGLSKVGKALFAQLTVGDQLAATDLYLRAGDSLFSFRSAWDPLFEKGSPGVILKVLMRETARKREEIGCLDSCASPGSWIEPIWPSRRRLTTGVFPSTPLAQRVTGAALKLRGFKQRVLAI